jgi:hypothetical protein
MYDIVSLVGKSYLHGDYKENEKMDSIIFKESLQHSSGIRISAVPIKH